MTSKSLDRFRPHSLRVITIPVPRVRLMLDLSPQLRTLYDDLLDEPLPERLSELVRRFEPSHPQP